MTIIKVKGQEWDVVKIDGNTITLKSGEEIEVSDETLAEVKSAMPAIRRRLKR